MRLKTDYNFLINLIILIFLLIFSLYFFKQIFLILFSSVLLTYATYPFYKKIKNYTSHFFSAILTLSLVILFVILIFSYIIVKVSFEATEFFREVTTCANETNICPFINNMTNIFLIYFNNIDLQTYFQEGLQNFLKYTANFLIELPKLFIALGLVFFITYFLYSDWNLILNNIFKWLNWSKEAQNKFITQFRNVTHSVLLSHFLVALTQGFLAFIGFLLFGVPHPFFLGFLVIVFSLIPLLGSAIIWGSVSIFLIISGYLTNDTYTLVKGVGLFIYGIIIVSLSDNILRTKLAQRGAEIHPLTTIIGIISGVQIFGFMGLIFGPILFSLLLSYLNNIKEIILKN